MMPATHIMLWACLSGLVAAAIPGDVVATDRPFLQRWGTDDASSVFDYNLPADRMLTVHGHHAVLWDSQSGLALREFVFADAPVAAEFTADGTSLLLASAADGLRVHDVDSGACKCKIAAPVPRMSSAAIGPDGRYVAAGFRYPYRSLAIWDARTGRLVHRRRQHRGDFSFLRFTPDGQHLLTGSFIRSGILLNVEIGEVVKRFPFPVSLNWAAFSSDGKQLLTRGSGEFSRDARIVLWNAETRQPLHVFRKNVRAAWFAGGRVVTVEPHGELVFVDPEGQGPPKTTMPGGPQPNGRVLLARNGWQLRIPADGTSAVLAAPDGQWRPLSLPRYGAETHQPLEFSPDSTRLLTAFRNRRAQHRSESIALWDLKPPRLVRAFEGTLARFSPDGRNVLVGGGQQLVLYDAASLRPAHSFTINRGIFESAQFLAGGRRLLTGSGDWYDGNEGQILLWDTATGKVIRSLSPVETAVYFARMDPDERLLVATFTHGESGNVDELRVLDVGSGRALLHLDRHDRRKCDVCFSPNGKYVAANDGKLTFVWETRTANRQRQAKLAYSVPGTAASFSHDESLLATHTNDGNTHLWRAEDGRYLRSYATGLSRPKPALFYPGGTMLLQSDSRFLRFRDLRSGETVASLTSFGGGADWLAMTSEGRLAGSEESLRRVTWRGENERLTVVRDPQRVARSDDPAAVGQVLTRSLPKGESLARILAADAPSMPQSLLPRAEKGQRPRLSVRDGVQPQCVGLAGDAEGRFLLVSHREAAAQLWGLRPVRPLHRFPAGGIVPRVAMTPDGNRALVEGPGKGGIGVWDPRTGKLVRQIAVPTKDRDLAVVHLNVHPKGRLLAVVYQDASRESQEEDRGKNDELDVWDLESGELKWRLPDDSPRRMQAAAFTPEGEKLLIAYFTPKGRKNGASWNAIDVWDWPRRRKLKSFPSTQYGADDPRFSADGSRLLVREGWGAAVRSFPDGKPLAYLRSQHGIVATTFTADGRTVVTSTLGRGRLVRTAVAQPDQPTYAPLLPDRGRRDYVGDLWIGGKQRLVFSPGDEGCIDVWRLADMQPIARLVRFGNDGWAVTTEAGYFAGSETARPRLSWQFGDRRYPLERFAKWTESPDRVADILAGETAPPPKIPQDVIPRSVPPVDQVQPTTDSWPADQVTEKEAIELLRRAGAELRFDQLRRLTYVGLEGRDVSEALIRALPAVWRVDRLYLADTKITDAQLHWVGLLPQVKRLSLWGNPITDRGLAELNSMWRLETLDVHGTAVTQKSLRMLRHLERLETLIVPKHVDVRKLKAELGRPVLKIIPR